MELFTADGHDAGGCERVTGKSGMRPPVVSVDTKKKELVGNFKNGGREWQPKGTPPGGAGA